MIRVVDVVQHYGVRPVLRNVSIQIGTGDVVVVVGPNGMGKSTLLAAIAGVLQPQQGYVEIDGLRRRASVEDELAIRKRVVYLPDHPWLPKNRTGREFLLAVGRLYEVPDLRLLDHVERLLELFELSKEGDWPIHSYSNGQQKKIAICSALVADTPILLLDEPFSGGLDPSGILALKKVLQRMAARSDVTAILTTPVPELVEEIAEKIAVVRDGQLAAYDTAEGLRQLTGVTGPFAEVLERLLHPQTLERIDKYFGGPQP